MCHWYWKKKTQRPSLSFVPGEICKSCNDIKVLDLKKDNGLAVLITTIKSIYAKDVNALAYMEYDQFKSFKWPDEISIVDYINKFECSNNKICQFDMILPTGVLAYKVLNNANISSEKEHLIRTTIVTLTFESMTKQLKAIYDSSGNSINNNDNFDIMC